MSNTEDEKLDIATGGDDDRKNISNRKNLKI